MRIAIVHSFYSGNQPSGENIVVEDQVAALRKSGHEVKLISRKTDEVIDENNLFQKINIAYNVSTGNGNNPLQELHDYSPDIVHVHNLFPNWGTNWVDSLNVPLVVTLHNYRHSCAAGTFYRNGSECFSCLGKKTYNSLINRCYRGSIVGSIPLAIANFRGAGSNPVIRKSDRVIALSERATRIHIISGVPSEKICVVPNFVPEPSHEPRKGLNSLGLNGFGFVGRLSEEKGISELLKVWPQSIPLHIFGSGPLETVLKQSANENVYFHGQKKREEIFQRISSLQGMVFSSRAAEGAIPLTYVEALSLAIPVLAFAGNGAADHVLEYGTGVVVQSDINLSINQLLEGREHYSKQARKMYMEQFSQEAWSTSMIGLYEEVIQKYLN